MLTVVGFGDGFAFPKGEPVRSPLRVPEKRCQASALPNKLPTYLHEYPKGQKTGRIPTLFGAGGTYNNIH